MGVLPKHTVSYSQAILKIESYGILIVIKTEHNKNADSKFSHNKFPNICDTTSLMQKIFCRYSLKPTHTSSFQLPMMSLC